MTDWLDLDLDTETSERSQEIRGVKVELLVSPYDIPEAIRGYFHKSKERFVIEFKYIGYEPTTPKVEDRYTTLLVGKNSGRLYGIELDLNALGVESVEMRMRVAKEVHEAIDHLVNQPANPVRSENYRLVKDAISLTEDVLFLPLLHCDRRRNASKLHT
jgi:hypothetical protein